MGRCTIRRCTVGQCTGQSFDRCMGRSLERLPTNGARVVGVRGRSVGRCTGRCMGRSMGRCTGRSMERPRAHVDAQVDTWRDHGLTLVHGSSMNGSIRGETTGSRGAEPHPTPAEHCTTPSLLVLPLNTPALSRSCCTEAMVEWRRAERLKNTNVVSKLGPFLIGDRSFYLKLLCEGGLHGRRKPVWRKCIHGPSRGEIPMGWRKPLRLMCTHGHPECMTDAKAW